MNEEQIEHERHKLHQENLRAISEMRSEMLDLKRHIVGTVGEPQTSVLWRLRRMEELHTQLMDRFNEYVMAQKKEKSRLYKAATDALKIAGGAAASYLGLKHVGGP